MANAVDIPYTPRPQQASQLCWAAATQIAVDVLKHPVDQPTIAAYAWLPVTDPQFPSRVQTCKIDIEQCNTNFVPVVDELGFQSARSSSLPTSTLTEQQITDEIDQGRPVIFGWQFDNNRASGSHFMVILGYHRTAVGKKLRLHIYDPLPVTLGNAQTISYANYTVATPVDLHNDMGKPYLLAESYYRILPQSVAAPVRAPLPAMPTVQVLHGTLGEAPATKLLELRDAVKMSGPAAVAEVARRDEDEGTSLSAGYPLPIVALGLDELRSAERRSLPGLLSRETGTVLYPVESNERVHDSFLMIKRGEEWIAGGYANTTVARLLVELRHQHAHMAAERDEHYLLSVPGLGGFFLAHGTGANATLIPVNDDRSIRVGGHPLRAKELYRADELLPGLAGAAERCQRPANRERSQS